jgi:hypothetical protein
MSLVEFKIAIYNVSTHLPPPSYQTHAMKIRSILEEFDYFYVALLYIPL